jgi:tetraacyldisaccharide 4'-kinase
MTTNQKDYTSIAPFGQSFPVRAASAVFGAAAGLRNALYDRLPSLSHNVNFPVISIGGLRAGGSGKTPVAHMVGEYLLSKGRAVAFLSRGYRRTARGFRIVKPHETAAWETIGDEPCLLHNRLPQSWLGIGASRYKTASRLALQLPEHSVFVLDDGFQHRTLRRNIDIVCVHENILSDRLMPWGFLREPVSSLSRAHAALLIGQVESAEALEQQRTLLAARFPHLFCTVLFQETGQWVNAKDGHAAAAPPLNNPLLVCGIARPERFIAMARKTGAAPCAEHVFPDHHRYVTNDFNKSRELYSKGVITTEKDAVRLKTLGIIPDEMLWYLTITMRFAQQADKERFFSLLDHHSAVSLRTEDRSCGL